MCILHVRTHLRTAKWVRQPTLPLREPSRASGASSNRLSYALDHGLTVRTSADIFDLLNFSNSDRGQRARPPTLTPTTFSMNCCCLAPLSVLLA